MMYGFRDEFEYFQCSNCECLQATEIPESLSKYYSEDYYSFSTPELIKLNKFMWLLKHQRTGYCLSGKGAMGRILVKLFGKTHLPEWIGSAGVDADSRILDVGCGAGHLLMYLHKKGFSDLTGVDPYIQEDRYFDNGVRVLKRSLDETNESFDFIMLHHSFEHFSDPLNTLKTLHEKTECEGQVLIRIPVVSSFAWEQYGTDWVQLDAPRHLFLHSIKSMELLSGEAGFWIESIEFDSDAFQFWGSEQYKKGIPLHDGRSYKFGIEGSIFTKNEILKFQKKAEELNAAERGDQACFLLRKITVPKPLPLKYAL
jgi:2-polyprenyl-3-methyl-5-hydroxy-6-metoxy-1,4-benzoquinol methylase